MINIIDEKPYFEIFVIPEYLFYQVWFDGLSNYTTIVCWDWNVILFTNGMHISFLPVMCFGSCKGTRKEQAIKMLNF